MLLTNLHSLYLNKIIIFIILILIRKFMNQLFIKLVLFKMKIPHN